MLQSELYVFQDAAYTTDPESIIASGMTRKLSDVVDLEYANINNGGSNLWLVVSVKDDDDAAAGLGYDLQLMECDTESGTYSVAETKFFPLASIVTSTQLWRVALPQNLKRYVKLQIVPAYTLTSGNELLIPVGTTSDSAAKVAGLIRAAAAQFLPNWVVTGATTAAIFTAAAVGVNNGTRVFDGGSTGVTGSIAVTTPGSAGAAAVYTLTVLTACIATGYIKIDLDRMSMTGDAHFNAAIVTG